MLFRKKHPRACSYCCHSTKVGENLFLCAKKGTVNQDFPCRKFRYDPCKRIPIRAKALDFVQYEQADFSL